MRGIILLRTDQTAICLVICGLEILQECCRLKGPATRNDIVDYFVTMLVLDAIFATLKSIVDDIFDDIDTCGMAFTPVSLIGLLNIFTKSCNSHRQN